MSGDYVIFDTETMVASRGFYSFDLAVALCRDSIRGGISWCRRDAVRRLGVKFKK